MLLDSDAADNIGRLEVGQALIKLQGRYPNPFLVKFPHIPIKKGTITDCHIRQIMAPYQEGFQIYRQETSETDQVQLISQTEKEVRHTNVESEESPKPSQQNAENKRGKSSNILNPMETAFLLDIAQHPLDGVVARYKRLGLSRRKGNTLKERCLEYGLIAITDIVTQNGRVVLLSLSSKGKQALQTQGHKTKQLPHNGSAEHEYWKHHIAKTLKNTGWKVEIEKQIPNDGAIDIYAQKGNKKLCLEIETGKSDIAANIANHHKANLGELIMVPTNPLAAEKIDKLSPKKTIIILNPTQVISTFSRDNQ